MTSRIAKTFPFLCLILCLQACSWRHFFQIRNTTEQIWEISYSINDPRGFFKTKVEISEAKEKKKIVFEGSEVRFKLAPGQTAQIGVAANSHYNVYQHNLEFDPEIPWKTFINMGAITFAFSDKTFSLNADELDPFLSKSTRDVARIDLKKLKKKFLKQQDGQ
ncbi:hypothetical protein ACFOSV_10465 [Algoriphagus namhaensis]|uniref:Lipoprotein n=1 Tax=Algoriphagus namhaensis TaxID=915353 RepID=A0ABV8ARR1_9BACT